MPPTKSGFKSLGEAGWIGFFSNIFYDRDVKADAPHGERFTLASHKEYAAWANSDPANLPELWFWSLTDLLSKSEEEATAVAEDGLQQGKALKQAAEEAGAAAAVKEGEETAEAAATEGRLRWWASKASSRTAKQTSKACR